MESMGTCKSLYGLELTIATPCNNIKCYSDSGCEITQGNKNTTELALMDMNHLANNREEPLHMVSTEIKEEEEERDIGGYKDSMRFSTEHYRVLEEIFQINPFLGPIQQEELAKSLRLQPMQIKVWFQNRRERSKQKYNEMECEYLRQHIDILTKENNRLWHEVEVRHARFNILTKENNRLKHEVEVLNARINTLTKVLNTVWKPHSMVCPSYGYVIAGASTQRVAGVADNTATTSIVEHSSLTVFPSHGYYLSSKL